MNIIASGTSTVNSDSGADRSRSFVRALARGLDVITAMSEHPAGMTLSEIAAETGLDRATTRRLLMTLKDLDYVKTDRRRFFLAPRVLGLGYAYLSSMPLWAVATPYMRELADFTKESCAVCVYDRGDVVYISEVQSDQRKIVTTRNVGIPMNVGARLPAYCTATGRVLLASFDPPEVDRYLDSIEPKKFTDHTITDIGELRAVVAQVADQGWCLSYQEIEIGYMAIAAPLHDRNGDTVAAMGVTAHVNRVSQDTLLNEHLPRLLFAAHEVTTVLRQR